MVKVGILSALSIKCIISQKYETGEDPEGLKIELPIPTVRILLDQNYRLMHNVNAQMHNVVYQASIDALSATQPT